MLGNGPGVDEKKYGKMVSIFSIPTSAESGVALAQAFCEHLDETLVDAVFKDHHSTALVIHNFRNCFLVFK